MTVDEASTFKGDLLFDDGVDLLFSPALGDAGDAHGVFSTTTGLVTLGGSSVQVGSATVDIAAAGSLTNVKGTLTVDEASTLTGTTSFMDDLLFDDGVDLLFSPALGAAGDAHGVFATTTGKTQTISNQRDKSNPILLVWVSRIDPNTAATIATQATQPSNPCSNANI